MSTIDAQTLFGRVIIQKAMDMLRKGSEIVGDFLSVVTTRTDEAGLMNLHATHAPFKVAQNLLQLDSAFWLGRYRDGLDLGRGELVESGVFLEGDRCLASVAYEAKEIR
jgi:hypothetical protein